MFLRRLKDFDEDFQEILQKRSLLARITDVITLDEHFSVMNSDALGIQQDCAYGESPNFNMKFAAESNKSFLKISKNPRLKLRPEVADSAPVLSPKHLVGLSRRSIDPTYYD